ncbi:MAG: TetR/AcrR family transcriptional regulator [Chloroflexota bacterium]
MSRREKFRQITIEEIKTLARRQMAEAGTASISLNAIARQMGISAPALYRYFASRDALITALIVDSYNALADALEETAGDHAAAPPAGRLIQVLLTYRRWALDHPVDFQLIFGNPIPGFAAEQGITQPVASRVFAPILRILAEYYANGSQPLPDASRSLPAGLTVTLPEAVRSPALPEAVIYIGVVGWYHIHGMIMLELFHHLTPMVSDMEAFYRYELTRLLEAMNMR